MGRRRCITIRLQIRLTPETCWTPRARARCNWIGLFHRTPNFLPFFSSSSSFSLAFPPPLPSTGPIFISTLASSSFISFSTHLPHTFAYCCSIFLSTSPSFLSSPLRVANVAIPSSRPPNSRSVVPFVHLVPPPTQALNFAQIPPLRWCSLVPSLGPLLRFTLPPSLLPLSP